MGKGGGRKGFMKQAQARRQSSDGQSDSDAADVVNSPVGSPSKSSRSEARVAQPVAPPRDADSGDEAINPTVAKDETKGQMTQRHKREAKAVKDQVKRLGKKGKDEGAKLLKEMEERHARELDALDARLADVDCAGTTDAATADMANLSFYGSTTSADAAGGNKKSKAQKRREKLEQEELERDRRIAEELEAMGDTEKQLEEEALLAKLSGFGLSMKDIPSDGHCLYRAIEDQIKNLPDGGQAVTARLSRVQKDLSISQSDSDSCSYVALRKLCAAHLLKNQEDFIHFVEVEDEEGYKAYCREVESTAAWGGHVELQALSQALGLDIKVHSADTDCVDVCGADGEEDNQTVHVCYLRHSCALGEHYNSCCAR